MKKTLIITLEYSPQVGGIATYVQTLARALDPGKVVVLAPKLKLEDNWDKLQAFKIIRKNFLWPKFIWPRWTRLVWHLFKIIRAEKIEIILVHHALPVGYAAILAKLFWRVPYMVFSHGTDLVEGTKNPWKKFVLSAVCNQAQTIVLNSEFQMRRLSEIMGDYKSKAIVAYPCPADNFLEVRDEVAVEKLRDGLAVDGKFVILTVCRLADGKGLPQLVRLLPGILQRIPNLAWIIVGDGPKRGVILNMINKNNLQNVVRYVGVVPHDSIHNYYHLADLFVLLTHPDQELQEGFGQVFLEAAACGLPAVAGSGGGVNEAVDHANTGLVVNTYNDKEVVEAITSIALNPEFAKRLGMNARERVLGNFRIEHQMKKLGL